MRAFTLMTGENFFLQKCPHFCRFCRLIKNYSGTGKNEQKLFLRDFLISDLLICFAFSPSFSPTGVEGKSVRGEMPLTRKEKNVKNDIFRRIFGRERKKVIA